MKYQAIIFDFDGVLFDSEKIHLQACNQVFHCFGFAISEAEYFQCYVGLSDNEMFPLIFSDKNIPAEPSQIKVLIQNKIKAYKAIINQSQSLAGVAGVKSFIKSYANKLKQFAICSGATREEIEATLSKLEGGRLRQYFNPIITVDDVTAGKPSPEGYLLAAKQLGVLSQYCLAIEDTKRGVEAAKSAGMDVIALTTSHDKSVFNNVSFIANDYGEIDSWIRG